MNLVKELKISQQLNKIKVEEKKNKNEKSDEKTKKTEIDEKKNKNEKCDEKNKKIEETEKEEQLEKFERHLSEKNKKFLKILKVKMEELCKEMEFFNVEGIRIFLDFFLLAVKPLAYYSGLVFSVKINLLDKISLRF